MVIRCEINFGKNTHGIFYNGEVVSGQVHIKLEESISVRGIYLKVIGYAECFWTEETKTKVKSLEREKRIDYTGREEYFEIKTYLCGSDFASVFILAPGLLSYNFSSPLPAVLPSSFEGSYGHVRYMVKIFFVSPESYDQCYIMPFMVLKRVNLNTETPLLRIPSEVEITKEFCCGPCRMNPLALHAAIPQSGYVPGQTIMVSATVNNTSQVYVDEVIFSLKKVVAYKTSLPSNKKKEEHIEIVTKYAGPVPKKSFRKYLEKIPIPSIPPTDTFPCKLMQIAYNVEVKARPQSKLHQSTSVLIPITIGTVPLVDASLRKSARSISLATPVYNPQPVMRRSSWAELTSSSSFSSKDTCQENSTINASSFSLSMLNLAPPTYVEAAYMKSNRESSSETVGASTNNFIPRYPVYSVK